MNQSRKQWEDILFVIFAPGRLQSHLAQVSLVRLVDISKLTKSIPITNHNQTNHCQNTSIIKTGKPASQQTNGAPIFFFCTWSRSL
jgi:hypothetical protein